MWEFSRLRKPPIHVTICRFESKKLLTWYTDMGLVLSLIWGWGWLKQALSQWLSPLLLLRTPSASRVAPAGWATPDRVAGAPSFWLFQTENPQFFYLPFLWPRLRLISCPTRNMTTRWGDANAKVSWGVLMYNSPSPARIFVVLTAPICFQDNHTVEVINKQIRFSCIPHICHFFSTGTIFG